MPLIALILLQDSIPSYSYFELRQFNYFSRRTIKKILIGLAQETHKKIKDIGVSITVDLKEPFQGLLHYGSSLHRSYFIITDQDYPERVAHQLGRIGLRENVSEEIFRKYQEPTKVDKIATIQEDLQKTKEIVHRSIGELLERGEKLEDLLQKTEFIDRQSKVFLKDTKKLNRCCQII